MVVSTSVVALVPLIIMTVISYHQYKKAFHLEAIGPVQDLTLSAQYATRSFLSERVSALRMVINDKSFEELSQEETLADVLTNLSLAFGGFVDLGVIDSGGKQLTYVGPYDLGGRDYSDQKWFHEVRLREVHISEVFLGYRGLPHFVIAVKHVGRARESYVLRATIDSEMLDRRIFQAIQDPSSDAFLVNDEGILQSPSRFYGDVLSHCPLEVPPYIQSMQVIEAEDERGRPMVLGYAPIENSPFTLMMVRMPGEMMGNWLTLGKELAAFVIVSAMIILAVVVVGSTYLSKRVREADIKRADIFHKMEYTNKLAALGRLGASDTCSCRPLLSARCATIIRTSSSSCCRSVAWMSSFI